MTRIWIALVLLGISLASGCGRGGTTYRETPQSLEPFARLEPGMSEAQVFQIIGQPTKRTEMVHESLPGGKVVRCIWMKGHSVIEVTFVAGKMDQKLKK